jgi:hypothetical protein
VPHPGLRRVRFELGLVDVRSRLTSDRRTLSLPAPCVAAIADRQSGHAEKRLSAETQSEAPITPHRLSPLRRGWPSRSAVGEPRPFCSEAIPQAQQGLEVLDTKRVVLTFQEKSSAEEIA